MSTGQVPPALQARLVAFAAEVLAEMEPAEVPAGLRAIARFAPRKRASAGAGPLWSALQGDPFRARVARVWATRSVSSADDDEEPLGGTEEGTPSAVAPDLDAAAGAWLRRDDWVALVPPDEPAGEPTDTRLVRATAAVDRARAERDEALAAARLARDELAANQRELRRLRSDADRARSEARRAVDQATGTLDEARREREGAVAAHDEALRERREAEALRDQARAEVRVSRQLAQARVRLLLDTIVDAASGLRHELALPPLDQLPADLVAPSAPSDVQRQGSRGRSLDDPALLDEVLRQPWAHLLVDGYNVSKTGFGGLPLDEQRRRLVDGLAVVAARTGAEITCCFDGQETALPPGGYARGVRVRFSVGEIADDLIRRLVRAEPPGRVVVVVTSDQAVARDAEADGAWVVPSATLVARLNRV